MTAFAVVVALLALVVLAAVVVLLLGQRRQLARLERLLAERPAGLGADEAVLIAEAAAQLAVAAAARPALPPTLLDDEPDASPRRSGTRIKAAGWAAGASETMRRLREGA